MTIVGIGNLVLDYYFFDDSIYINGGDTISNILTNFSKMGIKTKIFGFYGNDIQGEIAKQSLIEAGVDTSLLEKANYQTKCFFIDQNGTTSKCPNCGKKRRNHVLRKNIDKYIQNDDIVIIKDYTVININNKICLDFGYFKSLIYESKDAIEKFIFKNYYIVNIKKEALNFILKKLNITYQEFIEKNNIYFLIITNGSKGSEIIYKKKEYKFFTEPFKEIETNGCGDIFFATFISEIITKEELTDNDIETIYFKAQNNVKKVISNIGARNHIVKNIEITSTNNKCLCEDFKRL